MQQPAVELSEEGWSWIQHALEQAFAEHGKLSQEKLSRLDWPDGHRGRR